MDFKENTLIYLLLSHLHKDFYIDMRSLTKILTELVPDLKQESLKVKMSYLVKHGYVEARPFSRNARTVIPGFSHRTKFEYRLTDKELSLKEPKTTAWRESLKSSEGDKPQGRT